MKNEREIMKQVDADKFAYELKPCPYCKNDGILLWIYNNYQISTKYDKYYCECNYCLLRSPLCTTKEEAVTYWNCIGFNVKNIESRGLDLTPCGHCEGRIINLCSTDILKGGDYYFQCCGCHANAKSAPTIQQAGENWNNSMRDIKLYKAMRNTGCMGW